MNYFLKTIFVTSLSFNLFCFVGAESAPNDEIKKTRMLNDIDRIKHSFEAGYAPAQWKKSYAQWDLNLAVAQAKNRIVDSKNITGKEYQNILRKFLSTTRDYHVQIHFTSSEMALLPFTVKGLNGRYYIDWVDERILSPSNYFILPGDELLEFDGAPVHTVVTQLKAAYGTEVNPQTDQSLAELNLTLRKGVKGDIVPRGPVTITVKSTQNESIHSYQLMWNYFPEVINNPIDMDVFKDVLIPPLHKEKKLTTRDTCMLNPLAELFEAPKSGRPGLGTPQSFVPALGTKLWENEDKTFESYIYQHENGSKIGYIRIPTYGGAELPMLQKFGEIMNMYEKNTDALVIDQVNNPGGKVLYQYALISTLADRPFVTPKHHMTITQKDVLEAYIELSLLEAIESDKDAEEFFSEGAFFNTYEYCLFLKEFNQFIIKEWNSGRSYTNPTHLDGVDHINPHSKYRYTKPILVLINELDFSGGDFFPAILQDNKRATLFGTRTAGAGGCVFRFNFINLNGISQVSYTWSLAERVNGQPIEDLGVTPEIEYQISEADLKYGYREYVKAVNSAVKGILKVK